MPFAPRGCGMHSSGGQGRLQGREAEEAASQLLCLPAFKEKADSVPLSLPPLKRMPLKDEPCILALAHIQGGFQTGHGSLPCGVPVIYSFPARGLSASQPSSWAPASLFPKCTLSFFIFRVFFMPACLDLGPFLSWLIQIH